MQIRINLSDLRFIFELLRGAVKYFYE